MTEETKTVEETTSTKSDAGVQLTSFYGRKAGMTRIFDTDGNHIPVTVVELIPNYITQVKTTEKDGYSAYQVGYYEKREKLITKPIKGHLKKANLDGTLARLAEVRTVDVDTANLGKKVSVDNFEASNFVDVTGISKGKSFQGVIKRYNFSGGPGAHGSKFHRGPGSIGNRATPGRVFKNKKMPGHMGSERKTVQNLKIVEVNNEKGYMLIRGSVPGSKNGFIKISKAMKK